MPIPEEVEDKLDADPAWAVQHVDIIQVMDETSKSKPWSRYMIQQHLDSDPAKKTVQDRLDELVELGVLERYKYSNLTLYDLAYDPILDSFVQIGVLLAKKRVLSEKSEIPLAMNRPTCRTDRRVLRPRRSVKPGKHD